MQRQRLHCPVCGQMDMVRSVSVIVNEQNSLTRRTQAGGAASDAVGAVGAALGSIAAMTSILGGARFLVIRKRGSRFKDPTREMLLSERLAFPTHPISGLLGALSQPLLLVAGLVFGLMVADIFVIKANIASMFADPLLQKVILMGAIVVAILLLFTAIRIWTSIKDKPRRERAYATWQRLYHCSRDDVVFMADTPERWIPTARMRKLLRY